MLEKILKKHNIALYNGDGSLRNAVDLLEDLYLKTNASEISYIFYEVAEEEMRANIFDDARGRTYKGAE